MSPESNNPENQPSTRSRYERGARWRRLFSKVIKETLPEAGEPIPHYAALHPEQQKALARIERQIDERFSALENGKVITKNKTIKYKYKGNNPIMHEQGFLLPDYRFDFATIQTNTDRYTGVNVSSHEQSMAVALIELYLAKGYHVLATHISLNDPDSVGLREHFESDIGRFWELDICKDRLPAPMPNFFSDVETHSFGK